MIYYVSPLLLKLIAFSRKLVRGRGREGHKDAFPYAQLANMSLCQTQDTRPHGSLWYSNMVICTRAFQYIMQHNRHIKKHISFCLTALVTGRKLLAHIFLQVPLPLLLSQFFGLPDHSCFHIAQYQGFHNTRVFVTGLTAKQCSYYYFIQKDPLEQQAATFLDRVPNTPATSTCKMLTCQRQTAREP